jgi:hypothetical protein
MSRARDIFQHVDTVPKYAEAVEALLAGREAHCRCGRTRPSSLGLAFFEFKGAGSDVVRNCVHCGYYDYVHWPINPTTGRPVPRALDHDYEPRKPLHCDTYYCGCDGWD